MRERLVRGSLGSRRWPLLVVALGLGGLGVLATVPTPVRGQEVTVPASPDDTRPDPRPPVSPRGAFLRAVLVPGWGHAALGSYTRGGFYFALEAATAYAFLRTGSRLSEARERAALRKRVLRDRFAAQGISDGEEIATLLEGDDTLGSLEDLVASRERQREDLVAFGIFLVLLTGADAYVSAHLADFPTPIEVETSAGVDGGAEVRLRVPFPR